MVNRGVLSDRAWSWQRAWVTNDESVDKGETGRSIKERSVVSFRKERWTWTSDENNNWEMIAAMGLIRNKFVYMRKLGGNERNNFVVDVCLNLKQVKEMRAKVISEDLGALATTRAREFRMCWTVWLIRNLTDSNKVSCSSQDWTDDGCRDGAGCLADMDGAYLIILSSSLIA